MGKRARERESDTEERRYVRGGREMRGSLGHLPGP